MAGPVADRLALMTATQANLEPIYLVYDGGGAASAGGGRGRPAAADRRRRRRPTAPRTGSGRSPTRRRSRAIAADLARRRALIADGHHRYATYLRAAARLTLTSGCRPMGPRADPAGRLLELRAAGARDPPGAPTDSLRRGALDAASSHGDVEPVADPDRGPARASPNRRLRRRAHRRRRDACSVSDRPGRRSAACWRRRTGRAGRPRRDGPAPGSWSTGLGADRHRGRRSDTPTASTRRSQPARATGGTAVLLRPTPVAAVAAVAAAGARMPRKSTLFTPKPASGLVMRRFADQLDA